MSLLFLSSSGYEDNTTLFYGLINDFPQIESSDSRFDTFYIDTHDHEGQKYADVKINHPLDFEWIEEYNLTLRAVVCLDDLTLHQEPID